MKKSLSVIFISIIIYSVFTGCGKRCEDFNNDILKWMPYKTNETVIIQKNDILDTLIVIESKIQHTDKIGAWVKCECEDYYNILINSDSLQVSINFHQSIDVSNSNIIINNEYLTFTEQVSTYNYNNKSYTNVLIYENTGQSDIKRFNKILISKSIGIIGIIGTTEEWIIYDDSIKNIDISEIEQNNFDC